MTASVTGLAAPATAEGAAPVTADGTPAFTVQLTGEVPAAEVARPVAWPAAAAATSLAVETRALASTRPVALSRAERPGRPEAEAPATPVLHELALLPPTATQQLAASFSVLASRAADWEELLLEVNWTTAIPAEATPVVPSMAAAMTSPSLFIGR